MTNKLDFYTELISSILDSCCSYIVTLENTAIELISCYGNNPFDLDTLRLVVNNFDSTKKSFSIIDIKDFKNTLENESFISKNLDSIGYLPILDKNKIAIGYLITSFDKPFSILENQEKTIGLLSNKIFEKLRKEEKEEDSHIGNSELLSQTDQKAKLVAELIKANKELAFQNTENDKRANELFIANQELVLQNQEQEKRAAELLIANLEIDFLHREEHALFASIVDSSEDAMLSKRLDGIITSWNHGAEKIFGYSADEIIGKSILILIPPQLQHQEASIIEKIKNGETVSNLKTERLRKDGTIFYAAITISPIKNFDGNIIGASKVLQDISERKQIEEALQEKERKLLNLTNTINESSLISITDEKGTIIEINKLFCELSGYTKAELVGQNHRIVNSGYHDKQFWLDVWKTIAKGEVWRGEIKNRAKDGSEYWVASVINPIKDHNGKIIQYISIRQDITERKIAEEKINNNERQLNVIYNTVSDSFFMLSIEDQNRFKFISVNSTFLKTTGLNEEQIIGQYVHNVIPMPSLLMVLEKYNEAITGRSSVCWEETSVYPSGTKTGFVTVSPVIDEKNNCTILVGSVHDITERKRSENEMKSLTKRLLLATQSAQIGIWDWDIKNNLLTWDEGMYRLYSVAANEFPSVYEGWFSRLHPDDREKVQDVIDLALANKKDYNPEFRIVWGDSSVHYINASGIIERDNDGNAIRMIGVNWDITEQKEKEQHLKLLESVITNATDSILITEAEPFDEPGPRILYVNEAFTKMTGYTAADVIGKTPRILQGPKSDRAELKRLSEAIRKWESCEISTINYKKNGEEFWINCTLTPVANEKGWYTHWIAIERDVTVRKNEELQNKLIADISSIFSEPLKLYETLDRALRFISNFGDFCFAEAWLTSSDQNILKKISSHAATENSRLFLEETISVDTSIDGDGFTGAVAKTREITIWGDLANQKLLRRRDAAVKYGLKTILGLPLLYNNELVGVLAFGLDHELVENNKYLSIFKKLGDYLGPEIKRKQLELELNQMFNFAPDLIIIIGLDGCFNRVNPAASQLLGYTQQELCAEPYVNFIHPEDREKSANEIASLLETNVTYYFENRYMTKSGKIKWLAWNGIYVAEDNSIYAVAKDITDKKELENLFKKTNELARIGGWEVDLQNNTILWSDITREILEVAPDYIPDVQTRIDFYKKGSDRNKIAEYLDQAINTGKSWDDEFQIVTAKGNERWVRNIGEAEFVNGNCVRIFGSFQDIDKRKKAELKLIENENYLRTILDNEPECVKVLNSEGELVSMNPAGLTMIEADNEQQVVGQRMTNLVNKEYQIGFSQLSASVFKGNPGTFEFEITGLKGSQRWLETHAVPLKDTTGKIVNLLGVTRDITERKANESKLILLNENLNEQKAELVTSNKELEQFAYVASHDLQEPLRMVTSFLTLLEKRYIGVLDEKGLSYINFAVDGAKRMRQIILDILEFSRINTNDDGNYESVDLKEIIDEISLLQSKLIKEKKAKIIFEERSDVYSVRHYLMQLFQNIISNALKYSKEDIPLQIIIKSEEFDDFYQIAITDNGIGIEQEYFEKIFIIFQRLHGKEKYDGNGMGLAIVKKIVDKLNGKIWVESQVDVGSTFYINIPKKIR